ncbi:nitrate- and nitrite sensing domain-containing protein [Streptomyces sp. NPDC057638]|uniref:sensor histidine kinase n=1 Tax=Streptomyces sp. NPDC057638 TaxID=3346190 RepID=UPI00369B6128
MRFRGKSIRRKIVALLLVPLVSLTALWGFSTFVTGQEARRLLDASAVSEAIGDPVLDVIDVIQDERRQTLVHLADPRSAAALIALREKRAVTDRAVAKVTNEASTEKVRSNLSTQNRAKLTALSDGMKGLPALRRSVEAGAVTRVQALDFYNRVIDPGFTFLTTLHALNDADAEREGLAFVGLVRALETLSREDALITSAFTAGEVTSAEVRQLTDLVANRELYYEINLEALPAEERGIYRSFWLGPQTAPLREAEERLIVRGGVDEGDAADTREWQTALTPVLNELRREVSASGERHQDRVGPAAYGVFVQAGIAGILGFLALLVSIIVSVRIGRDLIRNLSRLRKEAHEVSDVRLPSVMRRLAAGEQVDVETEAPRLEYEKDEIGQAGHALNTLQRAAVEAAVRQAEMRRGVSEVFVNLARRNQVLLHRQLTLLDAMERRTEDTEELADLFRLDHLTTRMRRHAEGLVILSGAAPSRQWRKPVQLMDVVRAAVAEVEDYERIEVRRLPRIGVSGPAVGDMTHLIAELLENATVFSPPHTGVQVHGERVANGFTLEIHDRGLGMAPDALLDANLRLAETPEFELSDTDRLGLFVVSRLAQRQGVRVSLQPSPYGGTTAIVFIPAGLLTEAPESHGSGFRLDRKDERATKGGRERRSGDIDRRARTLGPDDGPEDSGSGSAIDDTAETAEAGETDRIQKTDGTGFTVNGARPATGGPAFAPDGSASPAGRSGSATDGPDITPGPGFARPTGPGSRGGKGMPRRRANGGSLHGGPVRRDPSSTGPRDPFGTADDPFGGSTGLAGAGPLSDPDSLMGPQTPTDTDGARGPLDPDGPPESFEGPADQDEFRPRPRARRRPAADERPQDRDQEWIAAPVPLPRRKPPTLVSDRGRRVDEPGRTRPAPVPDPTRAEESPRRRAAEAESALIDGLPRRVRQASLAPQLREGAAGGAGADVERDAEEVRSRMASMQRGWQRARLKNASEADDADGAQGSGPGSSARRTTSEGDGR